MSECYVSEFNALIQTHFPTYVYVTLSYFRSKGSKGRISIMSECYVLEFNSLIYLHNYVFVTLSCLRSKGYILYISLSNRALLIIVTRPRGILLIYRYTHDSRGCAAPEGECRYISKTASTAVQCYNNYVIFSKALSLCSACNDQDVVIKILSSKTRYCVRSCERIMEHSVSDRTLSITRT